MNDDTQNRVELTRVGYRDDALGGLQFTDF